MKVKKIAVLMITTLIIFIASTTTFASNVYVQLNGELVDFTDENGNKVDAQIVNNRTMVPLRKIFELLGATVEWDNDTRTAFAEKGSTSIKLQIDNPVAEVIENNISRKIQLDSKPILINNRTMVPLRFISESLGKQVAWDAREQTAIIIDYDYFANRVKQKSPLLYRAVTQKTDTAVIQITRDYNDLLNSNNNNTSMIYATISNDSENAQSVLVDFVGNSELFEEIIKEGWNSISFIVRYDDESIYLSSHLPIINKMLPQHEYSYDFLELEGKYNDDFSNAFKSLFGIEENAVNITTFAKMKVVFDEMMNLFTVTESQGKATIKNNKFVLLSTNNILNDYAAFDNIIFDNEFSKAFNVINKLFFNYDIKVEEVLYDYPTIDMTINISESNNQITSSVNIVLINNLNEKVVYNVKVTK